MLSTVSIDDWIPNFLIFVKIIFFNFSNIQNNNLHNGLHNK